MNMCFPVLLKHFVFTTQKIKNLYRSQAVHISIHDICLSLQNALNESSQQKPALSSRQPSRPPSKQIARQMIALFRRISI